MIRILEYSRSAACLRSAACASKKPSAWSARLSKTCASAATRRCSNMRASSTGSKAERARACPTGADADAGAAILAARRRRRSATSAQFAKTAIAEIQGSASFAMAAGWGRSCGRWTSMGAYIPAGRYPLPSTLLMTVIPAQVAGVRDYLRGVAAAQRGDSRDGAPAGVSNIYRMGGAHAIAAMAFGTETVPQGRPHRRPGQHLRGRGEKAAGRRGRDRLRRRADRDSDHRRRGRPQVLAADMLAQAEHDVEAAAILLTTSRSLAEAVAAEDRRAVAGLADGACRARGDRAAIARSCWSSRWSRPWSGPTPSRPST